MKGINKDNLHLYRLNHNMSQSDFKSFCSVLSRFKMTYDEAWQEVLLRKHLVSQIKIDRSRELEELFGRRDL